MNERETINKLEKELEIPKKNMCSQFYCARSQRVTELWAGLDIKGTMGYEIIGCYKCDGKRINCGAYVNIQ